MADVEQRRAAAIERLKEKRGLRQDAVAYVVVNAFFVFIWAITDRGYFWPAWIMGAWGIGLVLHAWTVYGQRPITESEIEHEMQRDEK
jgi:hypothetical protein